MSSTRFEDLTPEEQRWIEDYANEAITSQEFTRMEVRLAESRQFREVYRRYFAMDSHLRNGAVLDGMNNPVFDGWVGEKTPEVIATKSTLRPANLISIAAALTLLATVIGMLALSSRNSSGTNGDKEISAAGFAVIEKLSSPVWKDRSDSRRVGDTLSDEVFQIQSGTAEIQFFSGATMIVAGPAEVSLTSAWEATCREGRIRMRVPPAARGFKLHAPSTEIIDLGTEFGLEVNEGEARVEVFDGEISMRHRSGEERLVEGGAAWTLPDDSTEAPAPTGIADIPSRTEFNSNSNRQIRDDFNRWQTHRDELSRDSRLICYFTFDRESGLIPDLANTGLAHHDAAAVLAEKVSGRWPGFKSAMEFSRPGSRIRVNIPGEFSAFTFSAWVRIDSLDRQYNALFLGDGYENGEPHWQIEDTGRIMLSIMVDDEKPNPWNNRGKGFHRIYYSPPMWDMSMSGKWLHLASVYNPVAKRVTHFVNGTAIHEETIMDKYFVEKLRIGNGEIGNWGQPFREDPTWAIRNLNGRIDEFAIFDAALSADEIATLYEKSRVGQ